MKRHNKLLNGAFWLGLSLPIVSSVTSYASDTDPAAASELAAQKQEIDALMKQLDKLVKNASALNEKFYGANFGAGLALTFKNGKNRVNQAELVGSDKVVRVNKESNRLPKLMLETHYFFVLDDTKKYGWGPFVAIQPDSSGSNTLGSYALGLMAGGRQEATSKTSWNFGYAYMVNTDTQVLGDGIEEGKPLPPGETVIRYKYVNQPGSMVIVSFTW